MTWSESSVLAVRRGVLLPVRLRLAVGHPCLVEVWVDSERRQCGEGLDLFEALAEARRQLERQGLFLLCNGSRRDVYPSPMQRQAAHGRRAYVLTLPRSTSRPRTVDIFEAAPADADIATVDDQRAAYDDWLPSAGGGD
jgi:hypothetical protein